MFENIFSFGVQRTTQQAWGFYIGHLVILLILGFIAGFINGAVHPVATFTEGFHQGLNSGIGPILAVVYVGFVTISLINKKNMLKGYKYVLLGLLAIILAALGGGILGLIIPAVLSTKPSISESQPLPPPSAM